MRTTWTPWGLIMLASITAAAGIEDAAWIRDPIFEGAKVITIQHRDKEDPPETSGPQNVHTLFRKEVRLPQKPAKALLALSADDYCKFYANGYFVVQGPEPGYPFAYPYLWLDVTEFLDAGDNCLAAHAYYQGLLNRVWNSADNRSGFALCLDLTYADGSEERIVTDDTWRCHRLEAFPTGATTGYQTQFLENIDLRKIPSGWRATGFGDTAWKTPLVERQDHQFVQQITPPLQITRVAPEIAEQKKDNRYFYDFGREIVGHTRIRIQGPEGHRLTVRHGEELTRTGRVRYHMRCNVDYEEFPILTGGEDLIEFYDYRAFRYIEILDAPEEPEIWVDVRHHPFDPEKSTFASSDALLADIWTLCRNGVWMGCQGGFLDCPTREKGQYLGDAVIAGRSHLWLTGDPSLTKKAIMDFVHSCRIHPGMMAVAPGSFMQEIADYSLQFPILLLEYYRHTGDQAFVQQVADGVFDGLFGYFEEFVGDDGLIAGMKEKWVLVDWPKNLRDDYDYDYAEDKANTVMNAFYYGGLQAAAELEKALGRDGSAYAAKAAQVEAAFAEKLADKETGLYVDAPGSTHSSLHANAVPLAFGLTAGADPARMLALIEAKGLNCGVYIASYVIEACFRQGAGDLGYALLTSKDEHSWHEMLKHGATTCMEAWGPEQKWNTSWCHPWSSSPIYLIGEYVMGLRPAEPGWGKVRIAPAAIADLPEIRLTIPHPSGTITAEYRPGQGYSYRLPNAVEKEIKAPPGKDIVVREVTQPLSDSDRIALKRHGWERRVGQGRGVWISVTKQRLFVIEAGEVHWQTDCATAKAGTGSAMDSMKTPLGWHRVDEKVGAGAPWGQVFESRVATRIWEGENTPEKDLVLTRLLWLQGEEPGHNLGQTDDGTKVDSKARFIYIHGTNDEARVGTPSSRGCIRLTNDDVITAFDLIPEGAPVLITEG